VLIDADRRFPHAGGLHRPDAGSGRVAEAGPGVPGPPQAGL